MVTSLEDLKKVSGYEFELPPFFDGTPLTVKLKSPSIMSMVIDGRISNPLINDVTALLDEAGANTENVPDIEIQKSTFKFIKTVAESCVVEPKIEDINQYAGGLTDDQIFAIYNKVMSNTQSLSKFCAVPANS